MSTGGTEMAACTGCAQTSAIAIRMRIAGRDLEFHGCPRCESNTWQEAGDVLSLDQVLDLARDGR
jgi:hypothetical protein